MKNLGSILLKLSWIIFGLCLLAFSFKLLKEPDIWWMLRTGEWIAQNGEVVKADPFSFSHFGVEWINVKWLFELILYFVATLIGVENTLLIQSLTYSLLFYFLWRRFQLNRITEESNSLNSLISLVVLSIVLVGIEFRMLGRPEMMSHLMLVVFLFILEKYRHQKGNFIYLLIPLQVIWTNIHEAFGIGLVILIMVIFSELAETIFFKRKIKVQLLLASLLSILSIAINPRGLTMILHPFEILSQVDLNKYTIELVSASDPLYWRKEAYLFLGMFLLTALAIFIEFKKQGFKLKTFIAEFSLFRLVSYAAFFYLGFSAYRNIPFFILLASPLLAGLLFQRLIPRIREKWIIPINTVILLILVSFYISIVTNHYYKWTKRRVQFGLAVDSFKNPVGVTNFMKAIQLKGIGFSDYLSSSYLLWELRPEFKSFIDLRDLDVFQPAFFNSFFDLTGNPQKFDEMDANYNFQYAVVYRPELMPLQNFLDKHPNWELVYCDPVTSLFLKKNEENKKRIDSLNTNLKGSIFKEVPDIKSNKLASTITHLFNPFYQYNKLYKEVDQDLIASNFFLGLYDYDAALYHCKKSREKRGLTPENLYEEGKIFLELLKKAKSPERIEYYQKLAFEPFSQMSRSFPKSPLLAKGMGILSYYQGNPKQAINYLSQWDIEDMDFEMLSILSEAYANVMGQNAGISNLYFDDFMQVNHVAHKLNPTDFIINYKIAIASCQLNECEEAMRFYQFLQASSFREKQSYLDNLMPCIQKCNAAI